MNGSSPSDIQRLFEILTDLRIEVKGAVTRQESVIQTCDDAKTEMDNIYDVMNDLDIKYENALKELEKKITVLTITSADATKKVDDRVTDVVTKIAWIGGTAYGLMLALQILSYLGYLG